MWRALIRLRRSLGGEMRLLDAAPGVLAYSRGDHVVVINTTGDERPAPITGEPVFETVEGALERGRLAPHAGAIVRG
jgi:hypothetical protein